MKRLSTILDHLQPQAGDSKEIRSLKKRMELQSLRSTCILSDERLKQMAYFMIHEMHAGLSDESKSTLRMLPSFVYRRDPSRASGEYYALDLGGTNFRVLQLQIQEGKLLKHRASKFRIPDWAMTGTSDELFGFIADSIRKFEQDKKIERSSRAPLGFTFSFPTQQTDINAGSLIAWTKGFTTSGVQGKNLVKLLQDAIDQRGIKLEVVALCNDTVGTLIARLFSDPQTELGVILGTGSNACYWEKAKNVTKNGKVSGKGDEEICINMEFGNFDSKHMYVLPELPFDAEIDKHSPNPGFQRFEKMISGFYKGEIVRLIFVQLSKNGVLPAVIASTLTKRNGFDSAHVSDILGDRLPGRHLTERILKDIYNVHIPDEADRHLIQEVCLMVVHRSAQLSGMAIGATLLKAGKQSCATVAIDGAVYQYTPNFRFIMEKAIKSVVGDHCDVRCVLQKDGSGFGAGFIAALSQLK